MVLRCSLRALFLVFVFVDQRLRLFELWSILELWSIMVQWTVVVTRVVHVRMIEMPAMALAVLRAALNPVKDHIYMIRRPKYSQEGADAVYALIC